MGKAEKHPANMKAIIKILLIFLSTSAFGQTNDFYTKLIDRYKQIEDMPYICRKGIDNNWTTGCGDSIFWESIKYKELIVPSLLDRIDDTALTKASVPNFGGDFTVGDVAYMALKLIVWDIPTLDLAEDPENPEPRNGYWGYWNYTRRGYVNRQSFKDRVINWYDTNHDNLVWIKSDQINICDCNFPNPNKGHFEKKRYATIFKGKVVDIKETDLKGLSKIVKIEISEIIQFDNTYFKDKRYLNKERKYAFVGAGHELIFELNKNYEIKIAHYTHDYYFAENEFIKEIK